MNTPALVLNANVIFINSQKGHLTHFFNNIPPAYNPKRGKGRNGGGGKKLHFCFAGCLCYL